MLTKCSRENERHSHERIGLVLLLIFTALPLSWSLAQTEKLPGTQARRKTRLKTVACLFLVFVVICLWFFFQRCILNKANMMSAEKNVRKQSMWPGNMVEASNWLLSKEKLPSREAVMHHCISELRNLLY